MECEYDLDLLQVRSKTAGFDGGTSSYPSHHQEVLGRPKYYQHHLLSVPSQPASQPEEINISDSLPVSPVSILLFPNGQYPQHISNCLTDGYCRHLFTHNDRRKQKVYEVLLRNSSPKPGNLAEARCQEQLDQPARLSGIAEPLAVEPSVATWHSGNSHAKWQPNHIPSVHLELLEQKLRRGPCYCFEDPKPQERGGEMGRDVRVLCWIANLFVRQKDSRSEISREVAKIILKNAIHHERATAVGESDSFPSEMPRYGDDLTSFRALGG